MSRGGTTVVEAPKPSAAEQALQQEQVNLLRQQQASTQEMMRQQNLLSPILYKQMGISPQYDKSGKIIGYSEAPKSQQQQLMEQLQSQTLQAALDEYSNPDNKAINQMLRQRTLAALKGDLPVDPGLERNLKESRSQLEETLRKQVGPGYATSTPGIQALADFDARANELRYGARTGQLSLAEQLQGANAERANIRTQAPLATTDLTGRLQSQRFGNLMGLSSSAAMGPQMLGQVAQGFSQPLSWYSGNRQMQFQANAQNAAAQNQASNSFMGSLGSLFGTGLMAYAMNPAAFASDRRLKSNVVRIGQMASGLPIYSYTIFGVEDVGVMADEAREMFPEAVTRVEPGFDVVDYSKIH